jgi:hypothetical protein
MAMTIRLNSEDWIQQRAGTSRGLGPAAVISSLPPAFVPEGAETEEIMVEPVPAVRGTRARPGPLT